MSLIRYVDLQDGNDLTGDGSISKPYETPQKAYDTITDASEEKNYMIYVLNAGVYGSPGVTLVGKGNVGLVGSGFALLEIDQPFLIQGASGGCEFTEISNIAFVNGMAYRGEFTSEMKLFLHQVSATALQIVPGASSLVVVQANDCLINGASLTGFVQLRDCDLYGPLALAAGSSSVLTGNNFVMGQTTVLHLYGNAYCDLRGGNGPVLVQAVSVDDQNPVLKFHEDNKPAASSGTLSF